MVLPCASIRPVNKTVPIIHFRRVILVLSRFKGEIIVRQAFQPDLPTRSVRLGHHVLVVGLTYVHDTIADDCQDQESQKNERRRYRRKENGRKENEYIPFSNLPFFLSYLSVIIFLS